MKINLKRFYFIKRQIDKEISFIETRIIYDRLKQIE